MKAPARAPKAAWSLISSGTSEHESAFLDASASGNDAFFITAQPLVASDHDTNFDVYDALRVHTQTHRACRANNSACSPV